MLESLFMVNYEGIIIADPEGFIQRMKVLLPQAIL